MFWGYHDVISVLFHHWFAFIVLMFLWNLGGSLAWAFIRFVAKVALGVFLKSLDRRIKGK